MTAHSEPEKTGKEQQRLKKATEAQRDFEQRFRGRVAEGPDVGKAQGGRDASEA